MNNELALRIESGLSVNWKDAKTLAAIRATVAQGLDDGEFQMFGRFCQATGLNPFKKEVWAIKVPGYVRKDGSKTETKTHIMTGINGYHAIANNNLNYDGLEAGLIGTSGEYLPLTYPGNDFIGAWCKVYRKDRRFPTEGVAMLSEYDKATGNWKTMRRMMIVKCAESIALRKALPQELSGTHTVEEMGHDYSIEARIPRERPEPTVVPVTNVKAVEVVPEKEEKSYPPLDTSRYPYAYALPLEIEGVDMKAVRAELKRLGFRYNGETQTWHGKVAVEEIKQFLVQEQKPAAESEPIDMTADDVEFSYE